MKWFLRTAIIVFFFMYFERFVTQYKKHTTTDCKHQKHGVLLYYKFNILVILLLDYRHRNGIIINGMTT